MRISAHAIAIIILLIALGCSNSGYNPISPPDQDVDLPDFSETIARSPILISDIDSDGTPIGGVGSFGYYYGEIDPFTGDNSFIPMRQNAGLPDSLTVDITNFLTLVPCNDCVHLKGVNIDLDGNAVLKIGVKHPFAPGRESEAPSATNRLDLHVFSVRGFIVSDGIVGGPARNFPEFDKRIGGWRLVNADGYSSEFDQKWDSVFNTQISLHPFVLHFADYSFGSFNKTNPRGFSNLRSPTGNTVMPMGSDYDYREYVINILSDSEPFKFMFALTASYGLSAKGKSEYLSPVYRLPQYAQKNATHVCVTVEENRLDDVNENSWVDLLIDVLDINHGVEVGEDIDLMDSESSVAEIQIEAPDLREGVFRFTEDKLRQPVAEGGLLVRQGWRNPTAPTQFKVRIFNRKLAPVGSYIGIVKVIDSYPADANQHIDGNAIPRVNPLDNPSDFVFQIEEWATYAPFTVDIGVGNRPPNCELTLSSSTILGGGKVTAEPGPGTFDPDGEIIQYDYDMDYDGETFNVTKSNTTGQSVELGPYINESGQNKTITIAMRVIDNGNPAASSICTKQLTVEYFTPVVFNDEFQDNSNNWAFGTGQFWGIKDGLLGSSAGPGAQAAGLGCYGEYDSGDDKYATSQLIIVPPLPAGYRTVRLSIHHAVNTEIFPLNPYYFTDDCDVWIRPELGSEYKLLTTGGVLYNVSNMQSKDGPSFAGEIGAIPVFGDPFVGVTSHFENTQLAGRGFRIRLRQQTDDGINNCLGGWWIDWIKIEFIL